MSSRPPSRFARTPAQRNDPVPPMPQDPDWIGAHVGLEVIYTPTLIGLV